MDPPSPRRKAETVRGPSPLVASGETLAVILRGNAERAAERAAQPLLIAEAALSRHVLHSRRAFLDPASRGVDPQPGDVIRGRTTDPGSKQAREMPLAHAAAARQPLDREIRIEMLEHPQLQVAEPVVAL